MRFFQLLFVILAFIAFPFFNAAAQNETKEGFVKAAPGVELYYKKIGNGKQVIVVPLGSYLDEELKVLSGKDRTLVFYDTRGRGKSNKVDAQLISFENELKDLEAIRQFLNAEKMTLMGWSHYGMMTAVYAIRNPNRVERLVQITPASPRSEPYLDQGMQAMTARFPKAEVDKVIEKARKGEFKSNAEFCRESNRLTIPAFFGEQAAVAKWRDSVCDLENEHPQNQQKFWGALFPSMGKWDLRADLAKLKIPRLVIAGDKDFIPMGASKEWATNMPETRLIVLKGVGHHPHLERPEIFFDAVDKFLKGKWHKDAFILTEETKNVSSRSSSMN